jgi:GNAT superfamily N-acetyltransferase
VLYLVVDGDLPGLHGLRDRVFLPPLERPLSWPFVPHVTVADEAQDDRIEAATAALASYSGVARLDRVHLMREVRGERGRRWEPLADAAFGPPAVIGRGGLDLVLTASRLVDPEAAVMIDGAMIDVARPRDPGLGPVVAGEQVVITARREGHVVGVAIARLTPDGGQVAVLVSPACRGQGIGSHLLAAVETAVREAGWGCDHLQGVGPAGFYAARSAFTLPAGSGPAGGGPTRTGSTSTC